MTDRKKVAAKKVTDARFPSPECWKFLGSSRSDILVWLNTYLSDTENVV